LIRDKIKSIPNGTVVLSPKTQELTQRMQLKNFKINEVVNKYYSNAAKEDNRDLATLTCQNDILSFEMTNLIMNVTFCFDSECEIEKNKWILTDGKITITCIAFGCFVKVDNFNLKFRKTQTGYIELDPNVKDMNKILLTDQKTLGTFRFKELNKRFKAK